MLDVLSSELAVSEVRFSDLLICRRSDGCLHFGKTYKVYRTVDHTRLYVCCLGPHRNCMIPRDGQPHARHYLDECLNEAKTHYLGWEKVHA